MMNDKIDKIVAETIEMYNFRMRLETPALMELGTEELLERIGKAINFAAHKTLSAYFEGKVTEIIAAREGKE